jgi:hypothetical protein
MRFLPLLLLLAACTSEVATDDPDLDDDPALATIAEDTMPEVPAVDVGTVEAMTATATATAHADVTCEHHRYLHIANFSFVAPVSECVHGVCPNGCWGAQRRTTGFACSYDAQAPGDVSERDGGAHFASYNEIKPLNAHDDTAVARCEADSGHASMRTYTAWDGVGWDSEGIPASVHFAELYGPQKQAAPELWVWFDHWRGKYAPMGNISPETDISMLDVKRMVARLCSATRDGWLGLYFYNPTGAAMSDEKREAIIRGMNYCTTH